MSKPIVGGHCKTKGTRFLPEGLEVKVLGGPLPQHDDDKPPMWHVRVVSDEDCYQGLAGLYYVREDCLVPT